MQEDAGGGETREHGRYHAEYARLIPDDRCRTAHRTSCNVSGHGPSVRWKVRDRSEEAAGVKRREPGTIVVLREPRGGGCSVLLGGEFDVACHATLGSALLDAARRTTRVFVDFSGVTFLDASCVRELAILLSLYGGRVVLGNPSREAELSVVACSMDDLVRFGYPRPDEDLVAQGSALPVARTAGRG